VYQVGVSEVTRDPRFQKRWYLGFRSSRHCIPASSGVWNTSKILKMEHGNPLNPIHSVTCQKITCL